MILCSKFKRRKQQLITPEKAAETSKTSHKTLSVLHHAHNPLYFYRDSHESKDYSCESSAGSGHKAVVLG